MSMDNLVQYMEQTLNAAETRYIDESFALPMRAALDATAPFRHEPCQLLKSQLVFDLQGNLLPCCSVYDYAQNRIGKYLEMTPADVDRAKRNVPACEQCTANGIHVYGTYHAHPELRDVYDDLVKRNLESSLVQLSTGTQVA